MTEKIKILDLIEACKLAGCQLTVTRTRVKFQFKDLTLTMPKDFNLGTTEAQLITCYGWLRSIHQALNNNINNQLKTK